MLNVYALCCARTSAPRRIFYPEDTSDTQIIFPVPSFLVRHDKGNVLFDTGVDCYAQQDLVGRLGERVAKNFFIHSAPDENMLAQLAKLQMKPDDITHVINSHFHWDHCGCNFLFPRARFFVQRAEMQAARAGHITYNPFQWDHPFDYQLLDGEHDIFGDGTLLLFPTPGHTAGHQSLRVRAGRGVDLVFTADACYTQEHLEHEIVPAATSAWSPEATVESFRKFRALQEREGCVLLFGHDARQWETLRRAPDTLV